MSKIKEQMLDSNATYSEKFGSKAHLPARPLQKVAILTCMDARLDPAGFTGLNPGDAHIIRNAGGRASDDAIRSLIISHTLLGTNQWYIVHHTDCGMETVTNEIMANLLSDNLDKKDADNDEGGKVGHGKDSDQDLSIDWLTISDRKKSILEDVRMIREHPLVSDAVSVYGFLYDVHTGKLEEVTG